MLHIACIRDPLFGIHLISCATIALECPVVSLFRFRGWGKNEFSEKIAITRPRYTLFICTSVSNNPLGARIIQILISTTRQYGVPDMPDGLYRGASTNVLIMSYSPYARETLIYSVSKADAIMKEFTLEMQGPSLPYAHEVYCQYHIISNGDDSSANIRSALYHGNVTGPQFIASIGNTA